jgi:hypothetical protein
MQVYTANSKGCQKDLKVFLVERQQFMPFPKISFYWTFFSKKQLLERGKFSEVLVSAHKRMLPQIKE